MTLQEKYEKQKEIHKELVDENEALKFAARMSEKTEKQLREKNKNLEARLNAINLLTPELEKEAKKKRQRIADLEKENAELEEKINILENCDRLGDTITEAYKEQLAQAKELLQNLIRVTWGEGWNYSLDWKVKAEQFLEETE